MPVEFRNFSYSYLRKGKRVFAPSEIGRAIGNELKERIAGAVIFDDFYFHLKSGGHVSALHAHRPNEFFIRLDIKNFFYCIGRNRIARALKSCGIDRHSHYAKWSTVKNPFNDPSYALPYGFVQSPIVASLVLQNSALGALLKSLSERFVVSVYVDDISVSGNDRDELAEVYENLRLAFLDSEFISNDEKARSPTSEIEIFNCNLRRGFASVTGERIGKFNSVERSPESKTGFETYCEFVLEGNTPE